MVVFRSTATYGYLILFMCSGTLDRGFSGFIRVELPQHPGQSGYLSEFFSIFLWVFLLLVSFHRYISMLMTHGWNILIFIRCSKSFTLLHPMYFTCLGSFWPEYLFDILKVRVWKIKNRTTSINACLSPNLDGKEEQDN